MTARIIGHRIPLLCRGCGAARLVWFPVRAGERLARVETPDCPLCGGSLRGRIRHYHPVPREAA